MRRRTFKSSSAGTNAGPKIRTKGGYRRCVSKTRCPRNRVCILEVHQSLFIARATSPPNNYESPLASQQPCAQGSRPCSAPRCRCPGMRKYCVHPPIGAHNKACDRDCNLGPRRGPTGPQETMTPAAVYEMGHAKQPGRLQSESLSTGGPNEAERKFHRTAMSDSLVLEL